MESLKNEIKINQEIEKFSENGQRNIYVSSRYICLSAKNEGELQIYAFDKQAFTRLQNQKVMNGMIIDGEFNEFNSTILGIISSDNSFKCLEITQNKNNDEFPITIKIKIDIKFEIKLKCPEKEKIKLFHFSNNNPYKLNVILQNQIHLISIDQTSLHPIEYKEISISLIQDIMFYPYSNSNNCLILNSDKSLDIMFLENDKQGESKTKRIYEKENLKNLKFVKLHFFKFFQFFKLGWRENLNDDINSLGIVYNYQIHVVNFNSNFQNIVNSSIHKINEEVEIIDSFYQKLSNRFFILKSNFYIYEFIIFEKNELCKDLKNRNILQIKICKTFSTGINSLRNQDLYFIYNEFHNSFLIANLFDHYFSFYEKEYDNVSSSNLGNAEYPTIVSPPKHIGNNNIIVNEEIKDIKDINKNEEIKEIKEIKEIRENRVYRETPFTNSNTALLNHPVSSYKITDNTEHYQKIDQIFMVEKEAKDSKIERLFDFDPGKPKSSTNISYQKNHPHKKKQKEKKESKGKKEKKYKVQKDIYIPKVPKPSKNDNLQSNQESQNWANYFPMSANIDQNLFEKNNQFNQPFRKKLIYSSENKSENLNTDLLKERISSITIKKVEFINKLMSDGQIHVEEVMKKMGETIENHTSYFQNIIKCHQNFMENAYYFTNNINNQMALLLKQIKDSTNQSSNQTTMQNQSFTCDLENKEDLNNYITLQNIPPIINFAKGKEKVSNSISPFEFSKQEINSDFFCKENFNSEKLGNKELDQKNNDERRIFSQNEDQNSNLTFKSNKNKKSKELLKNHLSENQEIKVNDSNSNPLNDFVLLSFPNKKISDIIQKVCNFLAITIAEIDYILDYSQNDIKYLVKNGSISISQFTIIINVIMGSFCNYQNEFPYLKKYLEKLFNLILIVKWHEAYQNQSDIVTNILSLIESLEKNHQADCTEIIARIKNEINSQLP